MPIFPTPSGGLSSSWLSNEYYVSPTGNDGSSGRAGSPKRTIYEGIAALRAGGGGTLYINSGCEFGGPVPGQGLWLREDWLPNSGYFLDVPGFQPWDVPMNIVGIGNSLNGNSFGPAPMAQMIGADCSQFKPGIWLVGSPAAKQLTITGLSVPLTGCKLGARLWVDYDRELNGDIKQIPVLNATRTGTTTVLTVDIDSVTPIVVESASRTGNVTTLTIANPGLPWTPWHVGSIVRFTSGDVNFSSGDKTITAMNNFESFPEVWQISYAEIWVTELCWPEFREQELHQAIRDYAARDRRFGGLTP